MENYAISIVCVYAIVLLIPPALPLEGSCAAQPLQPFIDGRIIGGRETTPHAYPWIVLIKRDGETYCTGSVLSDNWVVTAYQCLVDTNAVYEVNAGVHDVNKDSDDTCIQQKRHINYPDAFFRHENFSQASEGYVNDIALIHVYPPFDIEDASECVRTIEIYKNETPDGTNFTVAGWGSEASNQNRSEVLREVKIPYVNDSTCQNAYDGISSHGDILLCAGVTGHGTCIWDGGSPLFREEDDGKNRLHGIKSWSRGCGRSGCPDVFTEVSSFITWINDTIENAPIIIIPTTTTNLPTTSTDGTSAVSTTTSIGAESSTASTANPSETTTASAPKIYFSIFWLQFHLSTLSAFYIMMYVCYNI